MPSRWPTGCAPTRGPPAWRATRCWTGRRPPRTSASACRASWGRRRDDSRASIAGSASDRGAERGAESRGRDGVTAANPELTTMTVVELQAALQDGATAADVTRAYLDRIAADDDTLGSYLHVDPEAALEQAAAVDAAGTAGTGLAGIPVALKDVVVTE